MLYHSGYCYRDIPLTFLFCQRYEQACSISYNAGMNLIPEIKPQQSLELLKELHILTRDGKLNQDSRRKLKQVYHLYQFIEPLLEQLMQQGGAPVLVDHGAGKSYLGFILYDLFMKQHASGSIIGIETRQELVEKSQALAADLAFSRMQFHHLTVQQTCESKLIPDEVEIVTALHACDTATDDAIRFALQKNAQFIVLVPCCQAEVAEELRKQKSHSLSQKALAEIWRHPIHTREFGSMVTNVLRCLQLESHGYQVTVTELVGWEHSMKNELIIAKRQGAPRGNAQQRLLEILDTLNLQSLQQRFS